MQALGHHVPTHAHEDDDEKCPICLESLKNPESALDDPRTADPHSVNRLPYQVEQRSCGHKFHQ